ncbi:MAG: TolC family protein, partial [Candidatus Omnitrophota bacterium]
SRFLNTFFVLQAVFLWFQPASLAAEGIKLDLATAVKFGLERNLELKAKREELGIADGKVIRSSLFLQHNPELEGEIANKRLRKPEEGFNKNLLQGGVSLSQEFEIGGQPGYRREAAQRNLRKVGFEIGDFERTLRFRVTELFLKLLNTKAKLQQAEQIADLRSRLYEASKTRLALGDIPEVQLIVAEFELNRAKSEAISLEREYEEILARLRTDLVLEKEEKIELVGDLSRAPLATSPGELLKSALERRPDLAALDQEKKVSEAEELLTRAERIPNVKFGFFYDRDDKDNVFGGRISIPIPVFDRKQAELREALSRKSIANFSYLHKRQALEKEIQAAFVKFKLAEKDLALYPEGTLKKFDEGLELYQKAYQERAVELAETILFQNQVIEARLKFIDALTNYNLALAELKFQAGIE